MDFGFHRIVLLTVFLAAASGCSSERPATSPAETLKAYVAAQQKGDIEGMKRLLFARFDRVHRNEREGPEPQRR
ncbi:MAG: hypothetical protein IPK58_14650 [Acidobacteria bacterium]|nr:hypothetical protein [Acidobacteriota bacterium]